MRIDVSRGEKEQEKHQARADAFWSQTVKQNNQRLNNKTMPDDIRDEIKFIQSVMLTRFNERNYSPE